MTRGVERSRSAAPARLRLDVRDHPLGMHDGLHDTAERGRERAQFLSGFAPSHGLPNRRIVSQAFDLPLEAPELLSTALFEVHARKAPPVPE